MEIHRTIYNSPVPRLFLRVACQHTSHCHETGSGRMPGCRVDHCMWPVLRTGVFPETSHICTPHCTCTMSAGLVTGVDVVQRNATLYNQPLTNNLVLRKRPNKVDRSITDVKIHTGAKNRNTPPVRSVFLDENGTRCHVLAPALRSQFRSHDWIAEAGHPAGKNTVTFEY